MASGKPRAEPRAEPRALVSLPRLFSVGSMYFLIVLDVALFCAQILLAETQEAVLLPSLLLLTSIDTAGLAQIAGLRQCSFTA